MISKALFVAALLLVDVSLTTAHGSSSGSSCSESVIPIPWPISSGGGSSGSSGGGANAALLAAAVAAAAAAAAAPAQAGFALNGFAGQNPGFAGQNAGFGGQPGGFAGQNAGFAGPVGK
ncbi:PE-PGRS family protein PE_PGRS16-like [Littorina saxatilis]|uniref:Uncharacterized protein n=1 Tax=Littorina saxatilis TaxID=31220 RepID=A0AAN9AU46_9CAEN